MKPIKRWLIKVGRRIAMAIVRTGYALARVCSGIEIRMRTPEEQAEIHNEMVEAALCEQQFNFDEDLD